MPLFHVSAEQDLQREAVIGAMQREGKKCSADNKKRTEGIT
jgi:hypothetical protein